MTSKRTTQEFPIQHRRRLAIIGGGSSGLITLKYALDRLSEWDILCYEKSDHINGCWGNPYPGFVSTSTKYTTQFSCFSIFDASVNPTESDRRPEFFRNDEYGRYLEDFASEFSLHSHIRTNHFVESLKHCAENDRWELIISRDDNHDNGYMTEYCDAVVLCTGLTAVPKPINCERTTLSASDLNAPGSLEHFTDQRIMVIGGGESAVDYAHRLANPELNNQVFLSLKSGVRISPRYHPIRGVPSDFLRNRLMLSIHVDLRNWIGHRFVRMRIKYQKAFERIFPRQQPTRNPQEPYSPPSNVSNLKKEWAFKLTETAKDNLFDMFHNKSDDFLDDVADKRITIVGPAVDEQHTDYRKFDTDDIVSVNPDLVVPAIGYRSRLNDLSAGEIDIHDFYQGCCHVSHENLFLVGFARPIIGNIPSISEIQARYIMGMLSGKISRPDDIESLNQKERQRREQRFQYLNLDAVYPVEMFPYCDHLASELGCYPSLFRIRSLLGWCRMQLSPATTMHYDSEDRDIRNRYEKAPVYMPPILILFLLFLKPFDFLYRLMIRFISKN